MYHYKLYPSYVCWTSLRSVDHWSTKSPKLDYGSSSPITYSISDRELQIWIFHISICMMGTIVIIHGSLRSINGQNEHNLTRLCLVWQPDDNQICRSRSLTTDHHMISYTYIHIMDIVNPRYRISDIEHQAGSQCQNLYRSPEYLIDHIDLATGYHYIRSSSWADELNSYKQYVIYSYVIKHNWKFGRSINHFWIL